MNLRRSVSTFSKIVVGSLFLLGGCAPDTMVDSSFSLKRSPVKDTIENRVDLAAIAVKRSFPIEFNKEAVKEVTAKPEAAVKSAPRVSIPAHKVIDKKLELAVKKISLKLPEVEVKPIAAKKPKSLNEINNDELVELKRIDFNPGLNFSALALLEQSNLDGQLYALEKEEKIEKDVRSVIALSKSSEKAQAKPVYKDSVKNISSGIEKIKNNPEDQDELIVFDYSDDKSPVTIQKKKVTKEPIIDIPPMPVALGAQSKTFSKDLEDAVKRAMSGSNKIAKATKPVTPAKIQNEIMDSLAQARGRSADECDYSGEAGESVICLSTVDVFLGSQKNSQNENVYNYSLTSAHDFRDILNDDSNGQITISRKLAGAEATFSGFLQKSDRIKTNIDLAMTNGIFDVSVPFIDRDSFDDFLRDNGLENVGGGALLIDLDKEIDIIELGLNARNQNVFVDRFYFNEDFVKVNEEDDYRYVLYVGVEPGNIEIYYTTMKNKLLHKIVHVYEGEFTFEFSSFRKESVKQYKFKEENLYSGKGKVLEIDPASIKNFNADGVANQVSLDTYEIKTPSRLYGQRDYFVFSHLNAPIYVGTRKSKVLIPTEDFVYNVLKDHGLEDGDLEGTCIVQVNLAKRPIEARIEGSTSKGPMAINSQFLEHDGTRNSEVTPSTRKIFIQGDLQGVISLEVNYEDGSSDLMKTYCSDDTYLVEQL
jgi:hypothetical protein